MDLRVIPRTAIDGYLRAVKLPWDAAARTLRRGRSVSPAELFLDRTDASIRAAVGRALRDEELQADARRRRTAAEERERAVRLAAEAEELRREADSEFQDRQQTAEQRREEAERQAEQRKQQAAEDRQRQQQQVAEAERQRKQATREAAAAADKVTEDKARRARLEELDAESEALAEREAELTVKDEASRLQEAANATKAARKQRS